MATTWFKAIHLGSGIAAAPGRSTDYIKDSEKTNDGELIDSYKCNPFTAASEFLLSKRLYAQKTGRDQGKNDVIAYHVRMSFKPGEVTAEQALELGRELAMRWTRGKHQFIIAAHTNTKNPHVHIIYNSVNLSYDGKYQDFKRSAIALRRVSDRICLEHGLSIIEKPGLSKGYNRSEYLGENKPPTVRDRLRDLMDSILPTCKDYDSFITTLQGAGVEVKRGKQLSFKLPGGKKFSRQDTLGEDYSVEAILERISGKRIAAQRRKPIVPAKNPRPNLLIDIETKLRQAKGLGFERRARLYNLKESAKTLIFLQERGFDDYSSLSEKAAAATKSFNDICDRLKVIEKRHAEIQELQKHIGLYIKTKDIYSEYRKTGFSKKFRTENEATLMLHKAAKAHFDSPNLEKLPTMKMLQTEYATLNAEKKKLYQGYKAAKEDIIALQMAKQNVDTILGESRLPTKIHDRDNR